MTDDQKITVILWLMGGVILCLVALLPVVISLNKLIKNGSPLKDKKE